MPIYAYKCESCGFAKDALQKISDAPLRDCPACGKPHFQKQVTAAGFQLKGSGWYVTDFRGGDSKPAAASDGAASASTPASTSPVAPASTAASASSSSTPPAASSSTPAASA